MIETARLTLLPLTLDQLRLHVADDYQLEMTLGLQKGHRVVDELLLSIITHFVVPRLKDPAYNPLYHTIWIAIDCEKQQIVADAKFKGEPDETGTVEIGYGTYPAFQRQGYMAEMVGGLMRWAGQQPGVRRVVADTTVENVASQRVLEKNGFRMFSRIEELLWWEYVFDEEVAQLTFDEYGYLVPYEVQPVSLVTINYWFGSGSQRRKGLWNAFSQLLNEVASHQIPVIDIWVDGSFITITGQPNDVDVVVYVQNTYLEQQFSRLNTLSQSFWNIDLKWVPVYNEPDSVRQSIDRLERMKWFLLFNTDRPGRAKGFVSINEFSYGSHK